MQWSHMGFPNQTKPKNPDFCVPKETCNHVVFLKLVESRRRDDGKVTNCGGREMILFSKLSSDRLHSSFIRGINFSELVAPQNPLGGFYLHPFIGPLEELGKRQCFYFASGDKFFLYRLAPMPQYCNLKFVTS